MLVYLVLFSVISGCFCGVYGGNYNYHENETKPKGILRPCPDFNLTCIREFFAKYADCTPAYGPPTDPYPITRLEMPIPQANMTFIWNNAQVKGLNDATIDEFYVNTATNKLVIEIGLRELSSSSPGSIARYHIKGKEPVELTDYSFITYRAVSLTATIPFDATHGILIDQTLVYAYMGDSRGYANTGSNLSSTEPELQRAYNLMLANIATSMREAFIIQGPRHFSEYLQSNICTFKKTKSN